MRVLILLATISCALAAPSGLEAYAALPLRAVAIPAVVPTISSGDLQAAAINAKVFVEDQLIAAADKARELAEEAVKKQEEKIKEVKDSVKEKSGEAFWSEEDKKWQAWNAVQIAEAQIDGAVAKNADAIAKSAIVPSIVALPNAIHSPILYSPGIGAPILKSISLENLHTPIISPIVHAPGIAAPELKSLEKLQENSVEKIEEKLITKDVRKEELMAEPVIKEQLKLKSELAVGVPLIAHQYSIENYPLVSPWLQPQLHLIPITSVVAKSP